MKSIFVAGVEFPIPDHWQVAENRLHTSGAEGILDAYVYKLDAPVDEGRLSAARSHFPDESVVVERIQVGGRSCLYCSYYQKECLVLTFSLNRQGTEIRGVYVLRPGNEPLAEEILNAITHM